MSEIDISCAYYLNYNSLFKENRKVREIGLIFFLNTLQLQLSFISQMQQHNKRRS